ncbi:MAG: AI-2E family transporter [Methylovulum sp.]|nr:AI-2E family transporter [Methylovulum sp.]
MKEILSTAVIRLSIPILLLAGILALSFIILRDFFLVLAWAFILAYVVWQPYLWLRRKLHDNANLSAALMTAIIAAVISLTLFWLAAMLQNETKMAYQTLIENFAHGPYKLPVAVSRIPWLGDELQHWLDRVTNDQVGMTGQLVEWAKQWLGEFGKFLGDIGRYVMKLGFVLVTVFFCFRDGQNAIRQVQQGLIHFLGEYQQVYLQAAGDTTRAVVYGIVLAALGQGLTAGLGYAVAGVQAPVLFGAVTAVLALIPMGAMLIWLSIAGMLLATGQIWPGVGLLLWGFLVVSTVDNVIRPLVISGTSQVPFLVVMFGVFGGLSAFGVVGLFLGPVILSVLLAVWQAWLKQQ